MLLINVSWYLTSNLWGVKERNVGSADLAVMGEEDVFRFISLVSFSDGNECGDTCVRVVVLVYMYK